MKKYTFERRCIFSIASKGQKFNNYNGKENIKNTILEEYKIKRNIKELSEKYNIQAEYIRRAKIKHKNKRIEDNVKPNLLNRNFATTALNKVWDTDVTYLIFKGFRAYLSTIVDLYDRYVVAYKISKKILINLLWIH